MTEQTETRHFPLMGAHFRTAEDKEHLYTLTPGTVLTLIHEPHNQYDSNAIMVTHEGFHLGYVPAVMTAEIEFTSIKDAECTILGIQSPTKPVLEMQIITASNDDSSET